MSKRGQISANVFIYVLSIVIVGIILTIGYNYISDVKERIDRVEFISLKNKLTSDIETISQDYGTFRKKSYSLPKLTELCLLDLNEKDKILNSGLIDFYPLIKDSVQSNINKNAFLLRKSTFESFFIGDIEINHYPHFKCLKPDQGKIELGIEGKGDSALILFEFVASIKLNPSKEIDLKSSDDVVELVIPEGTTAEVEGTPVEEISIEIVDPTDSIETGGKASDIYKFEPSGLVFSQPIELKIKYNLNVVGECPESLTFYQYNDDGSLKATIPSKEIDCKNQIATFEIDSFSFGYIGSPSLGVEKPVCGNNICEEGEEETCVKDCLLSTPIPIDPITEYTCKKLLDNGNPEGKINLFFISDGFDNSNINIFEANVNWALDLNGDSNGLFSKIPYKDRQDSFNVYTISSEEIFDCLQTHNSEPDALPCDFNEIFKIPLETCMKYLKFL